MIWAHYNQEFDEMSSLPAFVFRCINEHVYMIYGKLTSEYIEIV